MKIRLFPIKSGDEAHFVNNFQVYIERGQEPVKFYVNKRPHVDYFLDIVSNMFDRIV